MSSGFVGDFPDLAPGAKIHYNTRDPNHYFDPSAFLLPAAGFVGNLGRDFAVSPGIANIDWVLDKKTRIRESMNLEFRAEIYNLFNRANFGIPSGTGAAAFIPSRVVNPSAGRITETTGTGTPSRQLQLGLKLEF